MTGPFCGTLSFTHWSCYSPVLRYPSRIEICKNNIIAYLNKTSPAYPILVLSRSWSPHFLLISSLQTAATHTFLV